MYEANMNWDQRVAIDAAQSERVAFIRRTYLHVAGALLAFAVMLAALVSFVPSETMVNIFAGSRYSFLIVFGLFIAASYAATYMAESNQPVATQYMGLGLYTAAQAFVCWPLIWLCTNRLGYDGILIQAVVLTAALAIGLTLSVFVTKADFSWMRTGLWVMGLVGLGLSGLGAMGLVSLGSWFVVGVIVMMCGSILYTTSNVLHHYAVNQYVSASLAIFASIATLFRFILHLLMSGRD